MFTKSKIDCTTYIRTIKEEGGQADVGTVRDRRTIKRGRKVSTTTTYSENATGTEATALKE